MTAIPDDELLSAYLDGELTADEGARVERLLAERPESRQLLEELRLVRESLQTLPRRHLDDDFPQHVLRQAERAVLDGGTGDTIAESAGQGDLLTAGGAAARDASSNGERLPAQPVSQGFDWQRLRRPAICAALALAAGLLIMFLSPQPKRAGQRQVAQQAAPPGDLAQRQVDEAQRQVDRSGRQPDAANRLDDPNRQDNRPEMHAVPDGEPSSAASGSRLAERQPSGATAERYNRSRDENAARDLSGDREPPVNEPAEPQTARHMRRETLEKDVPVDGTKLNRADGPQARLGLARRTRAAGTPAIDDQTLIVWCEVAPDRDFRRNFDELLAAQQIEWQEANKDQAGEDVKVSDGAASSLPRSTRQRQSRLSGAESASGPAGVDARRLAETLERRAEQESESVDDRPPLDALSEPATELVLVEATEEQIAAMLAGLDRTPDTYSAVRVEPAASEPEQQSLKQFERGDVSFGGRAARARREVKQEAEKSPASGTGGGAAEAARAKANRTHSEFKSQIEPQAKKERPSPDHAFRAQGRAQRVLLERTPPVEDAAGLTADAEADDQRAEDAEADSAPKDSSTGPAGGEESSPAPPSPAPAARGAKPRQEQLGDETDVERSADKAGNQPLSLGRKLVAEEPAAENKFAGNVGEESSQAATRVYRVLFVFHPRGGESAPAAAAPTPPADQQTPDE